MARGRARTQELTPPRGFWLALFAATIQVLLPFLVALDLVLADNPAYAGRTLFVCDGAQATSSTGPHQEKHQTHHGLSAACPLCAALAAGQGFVAAEAPSVPLPQSAARPLMRPMIPAVRRPSPETTSDQSVPRAAATARAIPRFS